jgi:hypothetical protein
VYGRVLERAYAVPACREVLQLAVDAYACQHPGTPGRRSTQSVGIHLMTLCLVLERGAAPQDGPALHRRMVARPRFAWLEPPASRGGLKVDSVARTSTPSAYVQAVWSWAAEVWRAWEPHHHVVRAWLAHGLG